MLRNLYGPGVSSRQQTSENLGGQILTLHVNHVTSYTGQLLFLSERTYNHRVDNQGLLPWWLRCLGESKVRSASLVKVLSDGRIFWVLWPQGL